MDRTAAARSTGATVDSGCVQCGGSRRFSPGYHAGREAVSGSPYFSEPGHSSLTAARAGMARSRDPWPNEALGLGEGVPSGIGHLGLLNLSDISVDCDEAVPEVQMIMDWFTFEWPSRNPAVLDVDGVR